MTLFSFAKKNLERHKARTLLTVLGVGIAAATLFVILSFDAGYNQAVKEELKNAGVHLFVSTEGCPLEAASLILHGGEIPKFLPGSRMKEVKAVEGVKEAAGFLIFSLNSPSGDKVDLFYGVSDEVQRLKKNWKIRGSWFKDESSIILGSEVARVEKRDVGDKVFIESVNQEFVVSGIIEKTNTQDDGFYYLPLATAQKAFRKEDKLTAVGVQLDDFFQLQKVKDKLESLPDVYVVTSEQIGSDIAKLIGGTKALMYAILIVALFVSAVGVLNTVLMATMERRREFGYIRCVGATKLDLAKLILIETIGVCTVGWAIGIVFGYGLSSVAEGWIRNFLPYVPAGQMLRPDFNVLAITFLTTLGLGVLAGLYPALKASRVSPVEAIRYE
ncbi:MAG: ABC transporter permease [Bdellovibrionales bacterium]